MLTLPLLWSVLVGCTAAIDGEKCASGARQEVTGTVDTPTGPVTLSSSMCLTLAWEHTACDPTEGRQVCEYFFEPNTPPKAPLQLIYGDFVFTQAYGHLELTPPPDIAGANALKAALDKIQQDRLSEGYQVSPVQPITLIDGYPAFALQVSCDHPSIDEICPFTWDYLYVDLGDIEPGLYADFSAVYAAEVQAGNAASELPEEFAAWDEMIATVTLEVR